MGIKKKTLRIGDLVVPSVRAAAYSRRTHKVGIILRFVDPTIVLVYWIVKGKTHHYGLSELRRINPRHKQ
jgi:hypothetical protein